MSSVIKVVIIHGAYGSPEENWFPWLASEVRKIGHEAFVPALPTPEGQHLQNWRRLFDIQIGPIIPEMVLIGHSLAPSFILDLLERSSNPVRGTFLVSGFLEKLGLDEFDSINESFVCRNFDWRKIRQNAGVIHIYNGDNDPYVPLAKGQELAEKLEVKLNIVNNGGHINAEAGYKKFPQILNDLRELLLNP